MENIPDKSLSSEEKQRIKERLALLKKEYRRTVNYLQKSQKAERVKAHVKKTLEEQKRLQACPITDGGHASGGPVGCFSNTSARPKESQGVGEPTPPQEKKPCVTFKLEAEIVHSDSRTPPCSAEERSGQEAEGNGALYSNQASRSRLRLSRSSKRVCFSESPSPNVFRLSSVANVLDGKEKDALSRSPSPVFKRCSADGCAKQAKSNDNYSVDNSKPVDTSLGIKGVSGNDLLRLGTVDNSPGDITKKCHPTDAEHPQPALSGDTCIRKEPKRLELTNEQPLVLTPPKLKKRETTCDPSVTPVKAFENHTDLKTTSTKSSPLNSSVTVKGPSPANPSLNSDEDLNPLSSCTLVEGLLFPVEYYIRTTRRMASCQRKVDLDAVISSHLGTARKGTRGRPRRNSTSLSTPQNSSNVSLTPLSHTSVSKGTTQSRRGRGRKSCPALLSSGLEDISVQLQFGADNCPTPSSSQSEKENVHEASRSQKDSNIKTCADISVSSQMEQSFTSSLSNKKTLAATSQEAVSSDVLPTKDAGSKVLDEATKLKASPFPGLNSRVTLARLALDITDFHLPDEDFGILKLEKLKSADHLEVFTSSTPKEGVKSSQCCQNGNTTAPSIDSTAVLHGAGYPQNLESELNVGTSEHCEKEHQLAQNIEDTLQTTEESIAAAAELSSSLTSEPTFAALLQHSLVETKDNVYHGHSDAIPGNWLPDVDPIHNYSLPETDVTQPLSTTLTSWQDNREVPVSDSCEYADPATNTNVSIKSPKSHPSELTSVLFSTSLCSVPLESTNDIAAPPCTPGLPYLGSTPAIFSVTKPLTPSPRKEDKARSPHPDHCTDSEAGFISPNNVAASGIKLDTGQSHDASDKDDHILLEKLGTPVEDLEKQNRQEGHDNDNVERISNSGGGCAVDLCSVWWDFSGNTELCIVSASESSICLWRPQAKGTWECALTWSFIEMPVFQVLPLAQEKNIVCVALGNLEIMEIWAVFSPQERLAAKKQLVRSGHTKTAQGLSRHRLASSSRVGDGQVVEVYQLSEQGSTLRSYALTSPRDTVVAFCELEGESDALIGSTMDNYVVVWNTVTADLLSVIYLGDLCSDLMCLSAASDSGVLFLVFGSLLNSQCKEAGSCVFKLIAANPRGGASTLVMPYIIPDKPNSRYLEGDVSVESVAAVLTCGSIALWDLHRSHCAVILPPSMDTPWCLVRWAHKPSCLLTGQKDGTICIFEYTMCC
ncbi:partner and localizer of BRCA2 [Gastrophryne carolinensis]